MTLSIAPCRAEYREQWPEERESNPQHACGVWCDGPRQLELPRHHSRYALPTPASALTQAFPLSDFPDSKAQMAKEAGREGEAGIRRDWTQALSIFWTLYLFPASRNPLLIWANFSAHPWDPKSHPSYMDVVTLTNALICRPVKHGPCCLNYLPFRTSSYPLGQ